MDNVNSVGHSKTEAHRIIYLHKRNEKMECRTLMGMRGKKLGTMPAWIFGTKICVHSMRNYFLCPHNYEDDFMLGIC